MPICTCGCNQNLTRQGIRKHQDGQTVPRLVSAAVGAFQAQRSAVTPPQLNPTKKRRTSRRHLSSSPGPTEELPACIGPRITIENDVLMEDIQEHDNADSDLESDSGIGHMIDHMQSGVWSGVWSGREYDEDRSDSENDEEESDENIDEEDNNDSDCEDWENWQDSLGESDLSAIDMLGEEFEQDAVANGEFFGGAHWLLGLHFTQLDA